MPAPVTRRDRNVFGLPDGPWFPWSREFRWDLMPWNRRLRRGHERHRYQQELVALVEATATTIGVVAREAGFVFNSAHTGVRRAPSVYVYGGADARGRSRGRPRRVRGARVSDERPTRQHSVLYEASPDDFCRRYPGAPDYGNAPCLDLWVHWRPESGSLEVDLSEFPGVGTSRNVGLTPVTEQSRLNHAELIDALGTYATALRRWLESVAE